MSSGMLLGRVAGRDVVVPPDVREAAERMAGGLAVTLGLAESESSLFSYWSLDVRKQQWESVLALNGSIPGAARRVLEVGCGLGLFVVVGRLLGMACQGIEAAESDYDGSVALARKLLRSHGLPEESIRCGKGEHLDFPDGAFDTVCAFQTLEHVDNPLTVLHEAWRVLSPGGALYLTCPNYLFPYEAHYGLALPLPLGRRMNVWAVQQRGRSPAYLRTLRWITPERLRRWCAAAGFRDIDVGSAADVALGVGTMEVTAAPLPYRFRRGHEEFDRASRWLAMPLVRHWARRRETYPHIVCRARKPA